MSDAYDFFREGQKRLRSGLTAQATVPLEKAKRLEPQKASIREALGIAYFRLTRWEDAEREFRAITDELDPTDDYAHYALGRALEHLGRTAEANGHYKLASSMKPGSDQYSSRILDLDAPSPVAQEPVYGGHESGSSGPGGSVPALEPSHDGGSGHDGSGRGSDSGRSGGSDGSGGSGGGSDDSLADLSDSH